MAKAQSTKQRTQGASGAEPRAGLQAAVAAALLEHYGPPYLVVDANGEIVLASPEVHSQLGLAADGFDADLGFDLRTALRRAAAAEGAIVQNRTNITIGGTRRKVDLIVKPLQTGAEALYLLIFRDVDPLSAAQADTHNDELLNELQHRVKNILATVSALAARMIKSSRSLDEFSDAFLGRLMAMGATHELLSARNWKGAEMRALVASALAPHIGRDARRLEVEGPKIVAKPNAAASLGMVFHELATNAIKYGALSVPGGRIRIAWQVDQMPDDERLVLSWSETGGPRVAPPHGEGFGSIFVQRSVQYELDGTAAFEYEPSGLTCTIVFPFRHNLEDGE